MLSDWEMAFVSMHLSGCVSVCVCVDVSSLALNTIICCKLSIDGEISSFV